MTSATLTVFETAIGLATQAVHQDKAKNYTEAARCYKEAIDTFHLVKSKSGNTTVSKAIDEKITQYRERLKRIQKYLLGKKDLSKLFKAVVNSQQVSNNNESKLIDVDDADEVEQALQRGLDAIHKAKQKDAKHNFQEALKLYEEGMVDLLQVAVEKQELFPEDADVVKYKCLLIHERINSIYEHLETGLPLADRKDSNLEAIRDENGGHRSRHHSGNSNGFDSCSASPEPLMNITNLSNYANTTSTIEEEYEDEDEDQLLLMEEIQSNLSLASISAATSTTFNPVNFASKETDTLFQKAASEAGSRHSLYPMCEIKRSPSLISGQSDIDILHGKFILGEKQQRANVIPLADLDQELCISSFSLKESVGDGVDRSDGVKSTSMLSSASSYSSLSKHKYRSFHSSAEDVLAAYAICSTPESAKNYTFSEKDRNVSELTYNTSYIDPVAYKELCLNDSEGSDSGISSDPSPKNSARDQSSSSSPTMNTNDDTNIQEELRKEEEEVISRTLSEHSSICESEGEDRQMLLSVVSVYQSLPEYSGETISTSNSNTKKEDDTTEQQSESNTPNLSSTNINATKSTETLSKPSSQASISGSNDKEQSPKFLTPSQPLSREGSKSSRASNVSRPAEDELTVLSAEEIVEVDSAPMLRSSSSKPQLQELQIADVEVYGRPRAEYVPPRAFARAPNEVDDDEGINKGCYYFMSCLDAFWIL
jgi:hypothetical protein